MYIHIYIYKQLYTRRPAHLNLFNHHDGTLCGHDGMDQNRGTGFWLIPTLQRCKKMFYWKCHSHKIVLRIAAPQVYPISSFLVASGFKAAELPIEQCSKTLGYWWL